MSVTVTGTDEIIKNIEAKLGKARATRVINKALRNCGKELQQDVKVAVASYQDTGETHSTVIVSGIKKARRNKLLLVGVLVLVGA